MSLLIFFHVKKKRSNFKFLVLKLIFGHKNQGQIKYDIIMRFQKPIIHQHT